MCPGFNPQSIPQTLKFKGVEYVSMSWRITVKEDDDGEPYIILPDDLVTSLGWKEGDDLQWNILPGPQPGIKLEKVIKR